jgi:hypothetical protein
VPSIGLRDPGPITLFSFLRLLPHLSTSLWAGREVEDRAGWTWVLSSSLLPLLLASWKDWAGHSGWPGKTGLQPWPQVLRAGWGGRGRVNPPVQWLGEASTDTTPLSSAWPLGALVAFSCHLGQDEDWLACWCAGPCVVAVADSRWLWSHPSLFLNLRLPTAPHRPWLHYYFV